MRAPRVFNLAFVSFVAATGLPAGCCFGLGASSPEEVCMHLEDVQLQSQMTDIVRTIAERPGCVAGLTRMQTESPEDYATSANCIMAIPLTSGSLLSGCEARVLPYLPGGLIPRAPVPVEPPEPLVTDPRADPRCVEPCMVECGGASNAGCWEYCLGSRADMINARIRTQQGS